MPALFAYLIAVAILLGGGYGALNWLAEPGPVKVAANAKPKPPAPHDTDNPETGSRAAVPVSPPQAGGPEIAGKADSRASDHVKAVSNDQPPQQRTAADQQDVKAEASRPRPDQQSQSPHAEMTPAATDQEPKQQVEVPQAAIKPDEAAAAGHEDEKQSVGAASPGSAPAVASIAPATPAKRPHVRQASRGAGKRPLQMMTLQTIELPDGRHITRLIPYRSGNGYRDDGPAMAFAPDQ